MKRLSVFRWILTITVMLLGASGVNATIITSSDMGLADFDPIPQGYGDNVTSTSDGFGSYLGRK